MKPERNAVVQTAAYFASVGLAMALAAVLVGIRTWRRCRQCTTPIAFADWPCPTVRAITDALAGES